MFAAEGDELVGGQRHPGARDDVGGDDDLRRRDLFADRRAVCHRGVVFEDALDLMWRDPIAEGFDEVVAPAEEPQIAVGIEPRVVAGEKPAAAEDGGSLLGPIPVSQQQARIAAGYAEHTLGADRHLAQRAGVEQLYRVPRLRKPG